MGKPTKGPQITIRTPHSKTVLLQVMEKMGSFDEDSLVKAFVAKMNIEPTPIIARNVRRVVAELTEFGMLGVKPDNTYFVK